jgi:hypothetical protein
MNLLFYSGSRLRFTQVSETASSAIVSMTAAEGFDPEWITRHWPA